MATIAELRKQIVATAARLNGNGPDRGLSGLRKAELEELLAEYVERLSAARAVGGDYESEALREHGLVYDDESGAWVDADASTDPREEAALDAFAAEFEGQSVNEVEATNDAAADAELIEFTRVLAVGPIATPMPITETNVQALDGSGAVALVQFGSKLVWGKLIAVIQRRTKYSSPLLATVEVRGVRRLLNADDILVGDTFVA
jgi:hypothetical protein